MALKERHKERNEAALQLQHFARVRAAKTEASERRKRKEAAVGEARLFYLQLRMFHLPPSCWGVSQIARTKKC